MKKRIKKLCRGCSHFTMVNSSYYYCSIYNYKINFRMPYKTCICHKCIIKPTCSKHCNDFFKQHKQLRKKNLDYRGLDVSFSWWWKQ